MYIGAFVECTHFFLMWLQRKCEGGVYLFTCLHLFCLYTDLFEELVPFAVHQAMAVFDVRKTEIVNSEIMKLRESTQLINR